MPNVQMIFGNQYLDDNPPENTAEMDVQVAAPASEQKEPCCSSVKSAEGCESTC